MIHTMTGATTQYQRRNNMPKFIIHRTARRKADDMVIEAESERDAYEQMWDMANEGLFGVWNEYTDPWIEEIEDE